MYILISQILRARTAPIGKLVRILLKRVYVAGVPRDSSTDLDLVSGWQFCLMHSSAESIPPLDQSDFEAMLKENIRTTEPRKASTYDTDMRFATGTSRSAL